MAIIESITQLDTGNLAGTSNHTVSQLTPHSGIKRSDTSTRPKGPLSYQYGRRCRTEWPYSDDFYVYGECIDM